MQNRFKSPVVWAAITAQFVTLLLTLGLIDTGLGQQINVVVGAVLEMLVVLGILNNPTDANRF